jgi:hypothetical protein
MLSIITLNFVMINIAIRSITPSVFKLSVIMLSVTAPSMQLCYKNFDAIESHFLFCFGLQ